MSVGGDKYVHTDGHRDSMTESAQWADSVKTVWGVSVYQRFVWPCFYLFTLYLCGHCNGSPNYALSFQIWGRIQLFLKLFLLFSLLNKSPMSTNIFGFYEPKQLDWTVVGLKRAWTSAPRRPDMQDLNDYESGAPGYLDIVTLGVRVSWQLLPPLHAIKQSSLDTLDWTGLDTGLAWTLDTGLAWTVLTGHTKQH